jgi:molecular chaperone DnaJ
MKNYYDILDLNENASQDEIKKAYRKLSKQYHPDVNPQGEEKFKDISEAYDILGDESKKNNYDTQRKNPFGGEFDIHSMFEQMMNGGQRRQRKAPDKVFEVEINVLESYRGVEKEILVPRSVDCKPCNGEGGKKVKCSNCEGSGIIIQAIGTGMFRQHIQMTCNICRGNGKIIVDPCKVCNGHGNNNENFKFKIKIPANSDNGDFLKMRNNGDFYQGVGYGDLILKIKCLPVDGFEKVGLDLIYNKKISPMDLIIEDKIEVKHPDGDLILSVPEILDSSKPLRILNKGYKNSINSGNFYIKFNVEKNGNIDPIKKIKIKEILKES